MCAASPRLQAESSLSAADFAVLVHLTDVPEGRRHRSMRRPCGPLFLDHVTPSEVRTLDEPSARVIAKLDEDAS
ncbi:hypothetical protein AQJ23_05000 [Streptomyces antibioticus]|nr:hypothetical protein [Streptomyces antibioticus]KUN30085.1 hypothetical protein AQJ23_05000 [Streptomyces antibioticus]